MAQELHHFIGGKAVKGKSGRFGDVFNPATGEVAKRVPLASGKKEIDEILDALHKVIGDLQEKQRDRKRPKPLTRWRDRPKFPPLSRLARQWFHLRGNFTSSFNRQLVSGPGGGPS